MAEMLPESKLAQRLNRKVLPREISITDDPTRTAFEKHPLIGCFKIDDQGVPAGPVTLVEKGVLKTLLMSRRPREEIANSNGHARYEGGGNVGVHIGNLFITTEKGKTYKQLKEELLEFCEDQQLPFGLMVKTVDNPVLSGVDLSISSLLMRSREGGPKMTAPVMLYRVYVEDGREELVRGVSFSEITVKNLKDIAAVGNDNYVHNRMVTGSGATRSFALFSGRSNRHAGIPSAIVAPSVLFEELEFKKDTGSQKNPPLLGHPFFK
jgi:predicted Zn-dependent protease